MIKNKSRYAIMGVLNIAPSTGYDVKKYYDTVISGIWNENFGHIYPTLKSLENDGCIKKTDEETESRKIRYEITNKGKSELLDWIQEETLIQPVRSEFMLKFLFSNMLDSEKIIEMLNDYKEWHEAELNKYRIIETELNKGIPEVSPERARFLKATLRRGILASEASVMWCKETIRDVKVDSK